MTISFYTAQGKYGYFSNFSPHGFELDGKYWPTSEHYYQSKKFAETEIQEEIRQAKTPHDAYKIRKDKSKKIRQDWEEVKVDIMRKVVLRKFETHPKIQRILLSTGDEDIVENSPTDYFWGCGADGTGKNMLGKILMEVREQLRKSKRTT